MRFSFNSKKEMKIFSLFRVLSTKWRMGGIERRWGTLPKVHCKLHAQAASSCRRSHLLVSLFLVLHPQFFCPQCSPSLSCGWDLVRGSSRLSQTRDTLPMKQKSKRDFCLGVWCFPTFSLAGCEWAVELSKRTQCAYISLTEQTVTIQHV